jgi:hypothetical protein
MTRSPLLTYKKYVTSRLVLQKYELENCLFKLVMLCLIAAATGDMPTYQIRAPTTALPQGVVMATSPGSLHSPQQLAEEATRKRELRLMKNR